MINVTGSSMMGFSKSRLSHISILLIDPDKELSLVIKKVLKSLGFSSIHVARDGQSALHLMQKDAIDLVITDWDMAPMSGIDFINHVRASDSSPNPFVPIIMLTGHAKREHVEKARDTGITEFMVKPFTTKALCERIILVIDHPRNFVMSPTYKGPDRRRKSLEIDARSNRRQAEETEILSTHDRESVRNASAAKEVFMLGADFSLQEKIGGLVSARELFSEANIIEAQRIITHSRGKFLEWVVGDLSELEQAYAQLEREQNRQSIEVMAEAALRVKSRAGTFGYDLASQVAELLNDITLGVTQVDEKHLLAIRKHIDVMYVIFQRNILGGGGALGKDLMDSLNHLTQKYRD
jgi:two-component system, chemotaxis family, chemotaxis protein CheY